MKINQFMPDLLRGVGQVMLQNNAATGFLFLVGIFLNSPLMGTGALVGVLSGTLTAVIFKFNQKDITDGLYGFNGVLVGIALLFFFEPSILIFSLVIMGSTASSIIMNLMHERKLHPYTFPFVLTTWLLTLLINGVNLASARIDDLAVENISILSSLSLGFGQVMFQASIAAGIIFFIAILINSRIGALFGLVGSAAGLLIGLAFSMPVEMISLGILGYNGVLCGIAFAEKNKSALIYAIISILISILILLAFNKLGLPALTAPFVFATWLTLGVKKYRLSLSSK